MKSYSSWIAGLFLLLVSSQAWAQGVLIIIDHPVPLPRPVPQPSPPPISYKIKELAMQAKITDQIAQVQVTQAFVNTGSQTIQAQFVFPLPYDGAIDRLTFMVDGKEYEAKLLEKKKAREIYESYVRKSKDPALLEWMGSGMFQTSVFPIPPGAERKVIIKYSQLLRKNKQLTDFLFPLATAKYTSSPIEKITLQASIESAEEIKTVYSPTHAVNVQRSDAKHATVSLEQTNTVPTTDFRLFYDAAPGKLSANVISYRPDQNDEGYFLLLASPEIKSEGQDHPKKTVIFVLDRSGSMSGKKIVQAKEAVKFVLNNLREGDTFNIVVYDSNVESWKPELQKYDDETRKQALGFVEGIYAGGSTNIDGALSTALSQIKDTSRPNFVIFLTDGLPTHGETNEAKIAANAKAKNEAKTRIVSFGVGYDVNSRLLDRISRDNFGESEYVRPNENIEASVSKLYSRMSSPVLTDVKVVVDVEGATIESGGAVNRLYPKQVWDIFAGEQIVIAGRYKKPGAAKVVISGKVGSEEKKFDFPATLVEKSNDQSYAFVEKLWAMRRIGEIIDQLDLHGKNEELVKELVELSTKHGILTPYTSFLADDQAKPAELADIRLNLERTRSSLRQLDAAEGRSGFAQRAEKKNFQYADNLAPAATAPTTEAAPSAGGYGSASGGRAAGGLAAKPGASSFGGARYRDIETDREVTARGVVQAKDETVYRRGKQLIAANAREVDPEKEKDKIKTIKRFSDEYFALVKANTPTENAVLAQQTEGDSLLIKLRGQVYQIE
jgi:Ca-activated chloride channel family protein